MTPVRIAVFGLGYVGLPLAVALARKFDVIGMDKDLDRIAELRDGRDRTHEIDEEALRATSLKLTDDADECERRRCLHRHRPDAGRRTTTIRTSARCLLPPGPSPALIDPAKRPTIVFESTVYPGVTEEICGPRSSGVRTRARPRFPPRLQSRADQSGRPRAQYRPDHQGHCRGGRGGRSTSSRRSMER